VDDDRVNTPPTVRITAPENNATFLAGLEVLITADASDSDGTVARVDFYAGATLVGTSRKAPYSVIWTNVTVLGDYN